MKDLDFKDKSSPRIFGKGLMIVIVVVFSSLSFILGYFVGRVGRQEPTEPLVRAADTAVQPKAADLLPPKPENSAQNAPASPDYQTHEAAVAGRPQEAPQPDRKAAALPVVSEKNTAKQPSAAIENQELSMQKKETSVETKPAEHSSQETTAEMYTVQLGALKKAAEARKLRQKFEKKGYKTFLIVIKNKKHEKIYKIRVGEFRKKKEAEILALKLRKTEGLNAFVTVKN
jgi:cell division septation protein DedD